MATHAAAAPPAPPSSVRTTASTRKSASPLMTWHATTAGMAVSASSMTRDVARECWSTRREMLGRSKPWTKTRGFCRPRRSMISARTSLDAVAVSGTYETIGTKLRERNSGLLNRISLYQPYEAKVDETRETALVREFND